MCETEYTVVVGDPEQNPDAVFMLNKSRNNQPIAITNPETTVETLSMFAHSIGYQIVLKPKIDK